MRGLSCIPKDPRRGRTRLGLPLYNGLDSLDRDRVIEGVSTYLDEYGKRIPSGAGSSAPQGSIDLDRGTNLIALSVDQGLMDLDTQRISDLV